MMHVWHAGAERTLRLPWFVVGLCIKPQSEAARSGTPAVSEEGRPITPAALFRKLLMPDEIPDASDPSKMREAVLSKWDDKSEAGPPAFRQIISPAKCQPRSRTYLTPSWCSFAFGVIALENLVISLLAEAPDRQLDRAREMAAYISPRPGFTQHLLTTHATEHMVDLIRRAAQFRPPPRPEPYKQTPVFDEGTLPAGLRREHRTKPGVWGVIRVLEGRLRYEVLDPASEIILEPGHAALVLPDQPHLVEPLGPMRMQLEFYHQPPEL